MDSFESRNDFSDAQTGAEGAGEQAQAAPRNDVIVLQPDENGMVVLPDGASLDNLRADGRDLVLVLEDGTRIVIPEGAIIVPQIVFDGVTIPAANLAALLTGNEPQPAAGAQQSSGGNFEVDPGNIQDAFDIGDLLPYTQLFFSKPEEKEIIPYNVEEDPVIVIETPDNPVGVINAVATVDESGLPARAVDGIDEAAGTRDETDVETTAGTIVFSAPDGLDSVLIDGVAVTAVGQTIAGLYGTLTITSIDLEIGEIGFSYTLDDNLVGNLSDETFTMTVVDIDGDTAVATLTVQIIDDAPIANDDTDSVDAGTYGPIEGNVMNGAGTDSGAAGADEEGADGAEVTSFTGANGSGDAGDTIDGEYGTLTLEADGSYTYTRFDDTPGGVSDEFTYTLTDDDGSTATATLTIEIGDSTPEITRLPSGDAETQADEAGLPARTGESEGSDEPADSETVDGTITFVSPDGVASVTLDGVVVTGPGQTIAIGEGTLTITSYDPVAGTITYEYTLEDNTSGDDVSFDVELVVTDLDGDSATGTFTISVTDDMPIANDDSATQDVENEPVTVDVFGNDVQGADSVQLDAIALVDGTLTGAGSVAYNGDGTFTYTPAAGEEGTVAFNYTITDGDGDVSTATVTITLQPDSTPEITIEGADIVFEEALGPRGSEPAGSNETTDGEFTGGVFNLNTGGDSVASLVINGVDVTGGGTVTTSRGILTVTGSGSDYTYSYELTDNTLSDPDSDSFTLVVTDSDGDSAQTTIVIAIVDDAPSADDDANSIAAGEYGPVGGNVLDNDTQGADDATVTSFTGANGSGAAGDTIQGEYGTLTIAADGTYAYTRNPGTDGGVTDTFSYIITDGDGDTATANLVITIADSPVVLDLPVAGEDGTLVDEAGLPAGSDAASDSEFTAGTFTYDADDGPATVTIDGVAVTSVGQTFTGSFGTLTITSIADGVIGYSYELTTNTSGDDTFDSFAVVVTDQDGDSDAGNLEIAIVDDVPTAVADTDSVTEDGPLTADGNVMNDAEANGDDGEDTQGADGASVTAIEFDGTGYTVGTTFDSDYGSLVLNADGSYTYTLDNSNPLVQGLDSTESLTEVFTYTITDGDGDPSTTTLTITINGADDIVTINGLDLQTPELTVDEDDLADGSSPDAGSLTQSGSFTVDSPDGLNVLTVGGTQVWGGGETYPITITGDYGAVRITGVDVTTDANGDVVAATVFYEYELSNNTLDHSVAGEDSLVDSFEVVATDTDGSDDTASLDIAVVDDVPTANDDTADQAVENDPIVIDALDNDVFGADGVDTSNIASVTVTTQGTQGTVSYDPDTGLFTYTPAPGAGSNGQLTDSFTYTIVDNDGDSSTATVTVNLLPDSEPTGGTVTATVDDDGLAGGNPDSTTGDFDANIGDDPADTSEASFTGTLTFDVGNDGPATIAFDPALDGATAMLGDEMVTYSLNGTTLTASSTRGDIFTVELTDTAAGAYTVTLLQNVLHTPGNDENDAFASIGFTVTDSEGDTAPTTLDITFDDDAPTATNNTNSVTEGDTVRGNVLTDDNGFGVDAAGADGFGTNPVVGVASVNTGNSNDTLNGSGEYVVVGQYGTLYLAADGSYRYESSANSTNIDATDTFTYQIIDADGDVAEATLAIDIENVAGSVEDNGATVNEAGLATGSDATSDSEFGSGQITVTNASGTFTYVLVSPATGTYGTLTLDPDTGAYTYELTTNVDGDSLVPSQGGNNGANMVTGQESFDYEVYDNLGNLIGTGTIDVNIIDDVPSIDASVVDGDAVTLTTQDADTDGGFDTDVSIADFGGAFSIDSSVYGADGPGSIVWSYSLNVEQAASGLTSDGVAVVLSMNGDVVEGRANGVLVFTLEVNETTGVVTLTQYEEIDHDLPGVSSNYDSQLEALGDGLVTLSGTATITDGDGDTAEETVVLDLGGNVRFADDGPAIDAAVADGDAVTLTTFDADTVGGTGVDVSTANFGGAFSVAGFDYGADGAGSIAWDFSLVIDNATSGFTSDGVPVTLSMNGDVVEGRANGVLVFTVSVDDTTGEVTLTQYEEIDHDLPGSGSNYDSQLEALANGVLSLSGTATITDGDGDSAEETVLLDLGGNIRFADDGPSIDAAVTDGDTVTLTTQDADTVGGFDTDVSTANFGGAFSVAGFDYGADGAGSIVWDYGLAVTNAVSGLTSDGVAVVLSMNGDVVEGRANGTLVFTLFVNDTTGEVTLTQYEEIDHDLPGSGGNYDSQLEVLGNGLVTLTGTATITDGDGDTAEETVVLDLGGNVRFADDGPSIDAEVTDGDAVTVTTQDADTVGGFDTDVSTANFGGAFSVVGFDYGADGAGSIAWDYSLVIDNAVSGLSSDGVAITLSMNGDVVEGYAGTALVFTVAIDQSTGEVTLTQYEEIDHDLPGASSNYDSQLATLADGVLSISGTATITDGDGDTAEETVLLDLGGNIRFADDGPVAHDNPKVRLDDDALPGGNPGGTGDDTDSANTTGTLALDFGADGAGSVAFSTTGAPAGFQYVASGNDILIQQDQGSGFVTVITVTLDPSTGDYAVTQNLPILHAQGDDENYQVLALTYTVTDGDGDTDTSVLLINVNDDTPTAIDTNSTGTVDEDGLGGNAGGIGDVTGEATVANGSVTSLFSAGADAPLTFGFDSASVVSYLESLGLQTGGVDLEYELSGDTITATLPGATIFTFTLSGDGDWQFNLLGPVDHPVANTEDDIVIDFGPLIQATDADGDTVAAIGSVLITIDDDTPVAYPDTNSLTEDTASVGGNVITDDSFGGDMAGDPAVTTVTGFGDAAGTVGGTTTGEFGTLTLNGDGTYNYALNTASVQYLDDGESETDSFTYTIVDADGDTSTATLVITINGANDAPEAEDDTNWVLDVTTGPKPTTSGNVLQDVAHPGAPSGTFADVADTDVDGDTLSVTGVNGGSVGVWLSGSYGAIVINADGTYTYSLYSDNALVNALDDGESINDTFTYIVSDGDATDEATLTITIFGTNDAPVVGVDAVAVSDEGLAGGNPDTVGTPFDTTDSATATGTVAVSDVDGDSLTVTLGLPTSGSLASGGVAVQWVLQNGGQTLVGYATDVNDPVVTVTIDNNGDFTVNQLQQIDHPTSGIEDILQLVIPVTADDGSVTTTNVNGISIVFEDDSPIIGDFTPDDPTIPNAAFEQATGTFDYSPGGDDHGEFQINYTGAPVTGLTYTTVQIDADNDGHNDGAILTASSGTTDVYTLEVDVDGNYTFTLIEPDAGETRTVSLLGLTAGGPQPFVQTPDGLIEFTGNGSGVNSSTQGFGVSNQFVGTGEQFTVEFHSVGAPGNQSPLTDPEFVSSATLAVNRGSSTVEYKITIYNDADGTSEVIGTNITFPADNSTYTFEGTTLGTFNRFTVEAISGSGQGARFSSLSYTVNILPEDFQVEFAISATDSDGDITSVSSLSVFVDASLAPAPLSMVSSKLLTDAEALDMAIMGSGESQAGSMTGPSSGAPRMMARGNEMTAIAASAAAFAIPTIESAFAQEFGETASPGDIMVNFEYSASPTLEAPQLQEGFAMTFDARVEVDGGAAQDLAMANILGDADDFRLAMAEAAGGPEADGFDYASGSEGFEAAPSAFEGLAAGDTGSAMEALLMLEASSPTAQSIDLADAAKALGEAVADINAEAQVDAVVEHFAANDIGAGGSGSITTPVEGLLDGMIGSDLAFNAVGIAQTDQADEAALAVVSA